MEKTINNVTESVEKYFKRRIIFELVNDLRGAIDWSRIEGTQLHYNIINVAQALEDLYIKEATYLVTYLIKLKKIKQQPLKHYITDLCKCTSEYLETKVPHILSKIDELILFSLNEIAANRYNSDIITLFGGYIYFHDNSHRLIEIVKQLRLKRLVEEKPFGTDTYWGYFLSIFPEVPEEFRIKAGLNLLKKYHSRPIHEKRWKYLEQDINRELSHRAEISGISPLQLVILSILVSIFSLPKAVVKKEREHSWREWKETLLEDLSYNDLFKNPKILKRLLNKLTTSDIAPPGWNRKYRDLPWIEERKYPGKGEGRGELEIAATIIHKKRFSDWYFAEINELNTGLALEAKLDSLNLTPRERTIIEAKLAGIEPPGTPGSIRKALSKVREKAKKNKKN